MKQKPSKKIALNRDSRTGRFVTAAYRRANPDTTQREMRARPARPSHAGARVTR